MPTNPSVKTAREKPRNWTASVGFPGVDAHHSYATPVRDLTPAPAISPLPLLPVPGPWTDSRQDSGSGNKEYWQERNASQLQEEKRITQDDVSVPNPQTPVKRMIDARQNFVPVERANAHRGPLMSLMMRPPFQWRNMRRFTGNMGGFQYTPSLHPGVEQFGDGRGRKRFRTTQRNNPTPAEQQIVSTVDQQGFSQSIMKKVSSSQPLVKWW